MDPFQDLNRRLAEQSDQMTKREFFAIHVLHALITSDNNRDVNAKDVLIITDNLIKVLKETPPHG